MPEAYHEGSPREITGGGIQVLPKDLKKGEKLGLCGG